MSPLALHLLIASTGLLVACSMGVLVSRGLARRPVESYRCLVAILVASLLLPLAQIAVEGRLELDALGTLAGDPALPGRAPSDTAAPPREELAAAPQQGSPAGQPPPIDEASQPGAEEERRGRLGEAVAALAGVGWFDHAQPERALRDGGAARSAWLSPRLVLAVWLFGATAAALRLLLRLLRTRRILASARPVTDPGVLALWNELAEHSPMARRTRLLLCDALRTPVCFGLRRARILLPAMQGMGGGRDVLRCVLLHELVHLERRDTRTMLLQELLHCVFWFHPAAWWLNRKLDALRELSCDLLVVRRIGRCKRYASALLEYASFSTRDARQAASAVLLPWTRSTGQLTRRIEMLLNLQSLSPWRTRRFVLSALGGGLFLLWSGQIAVAAAVFPAPPAAEAANLRALVESEEGEEPRSVREREFMIGISLGKTDAQRHGRDASSALVIESVYEGTLAERCGLKAGDLILAIDGDTQVTVDAVGRCKKRMLHGESVVFRIGRGEDELDVELSLSGEGKKKRERAAELLEEALSLDPANISIRKALDAARRARQQYAEGVDRWQSYAEGENYAGSARNLYDAARRYYSSIDAEDLREELERGLRHHRELIEGGHLDDATRGYWNRVKEIYEEGDLETYLHNARAYMERTAPEEVQKKFVEEFGKLDGRTRQYIEERLSKHGWGSTGWTQKHAENTTRTREPREEGRARARARSMPEEQAHEKAALNARARALEAELERTRELLERSRTQIEALRRQVEQLARKLESR